MTTPIQITETQLHNIILGTVNRMLKENIVSSFSIDELSQIPTFEQRMQYCEEKLGKPIGRGSSRIVYKIDDEKVLKLARNGKGIAQNQVEGADDYVKDKYDIFPKVFAKSEDYTWLMAELVQPATREDFENCFYMTFEQWIEFIKKFDEWYRGSIFVRSKLSDRYVKQVIEGNENIRQFNDFICNYDYIRTNDLRALDNYGVAMRNDKPWIALIDSGLSDDVYKQHYLRR